MSTSWTAKEVHEALLEAIRLGYVEVRLDSEGVPRYWLTKRGEKHMDDLLEDPEDDEL